MDLIFSVLRDFLFGFLIGTAIACTLVCAGAALYLLLT